MRTFLTWAPWGWLTLMSVVHVGVDVVGQHARGLHPPGRETTLYDGLHVSFAFGQLLLGLVGLYLTYRARELLLELPVVAIALLGAAGFLAIATFFTDYTPPRINAVIFAVLVIASTWSGRTAATTTPTTAAAQTR